MPDPGVTPVQRQGYPSEVGAVDPTGRQQRYDDRGVEPLIFDALAGLGQVAGAASLGT